MDDKRRGRITIFNVLFVLALYLVHQHEYYKRYEFEPIFYPMVFFISSFIVSFLWFYYLFLSKLPTVYSFQVPRDVNATSASSYRDEFIKKLFWMSGAFWIPVGFYWGWKQGHLVDELIEWLSTFQEIASYLYMLGG